MFDAAGLMKYWFPVSRMPKNGGKWPTCDDMVQKNQRLVVFTSKSVRRPLEELPMNGDMLWKSNLSPIIFLNLEQFTG